MRTGKADTLLPPLRPYKPAYRTLSSVCVCYSMLGGIGPFYVFVSVPLRFICLSLKHKGHTQCQYTAQHVRRRNSTGVILIAPVPRRAVEDQAFTVAQSICTSSVYVCYVREGYITAHTRPTGHTTCRGPVSCNDVRLVVHAVQ